MSRAAANREARFQASLDNPLLVFKVGVLGCAPLHLMEEIAETYDADYFSSDETRLEIMEEGEDDSPSVDTREIRERIVSGASAALADDRDVVIDMFFNSANSRRVPIDLAQEMGATSIALRTNAPYGLACERVEKWTEEDGFLIPVKQWEVPPIVAAKRMMDSVEYPSELEGIDYVFGVNGARDTEAILNQYETHLERAGLMGRYVDA